MSAPQIPEPLLPRKGYRAALIGYHIGGGPIAVAAYAYVPAVGGPPPATDKRHFSRIKFSTAQVAEGQPIFKSWREAGLPGAQYNGTEFVTYKAGQIADLPTFESEAIIWAGAADLIKNHAEG